MSLKTAPANRWPTAVPWCSSTVKIDGAARPASASIPPSHATSASMYRYRSTIMPIIIMIVAPPGLRSSSFVGGNRALRGRLSPRGAHICTFRYMSDTPNAIAWLEWDKAAFARAVREDKPILLSLVAPWCEHCAVMDHAAYSRADIAHLVATLFVPVRVNTDRRP